MNSQLTWEKDRNSEGVFHYAETTTGDYYTIQRDAKLGRCVLRHEFLDEDAAPCSEVLGKGTLIAMKDKAQQHYSGIVADIEEHVPDDDTPTPVNMGYERPMTLTNPDEPLPPLPEPAGCPDETGVTNYTEERAFVMNRARPEEPEPDHENDEPPPEQPEPCRVGRFTLPEDPDAPPVTPEESEKMSHLALTTKLARRLIRCGCSAGTAAAVFGQLSKRGARKLRKALHALGAVHLAAAPRTAAA